MLGSGFWVSYKRRSVKLVCFSLKSGSEGGWGGRYFPGWTEETRAGVVLFSPWRADESLDRGEAAKSGPVESAGDVGGTSRGSERRRSGG